MRLPKPPGRAAHDDLLTRELAPRMLFEFAHDPPDVATVASWLVKRDVWFLALRREARRRKQPLPELPPTLVAFTAGDPVAARVAYGMESPVAPGVYAGAPSGTYLRTMLWPHVTALRLALRADPSPEAQEIAMDAEKIHNKLVEQLRKGRKEGHLAGLQEGLQEGLRTAIAQVCSTRRLRLTAAQRAALAAADDPATLRRWHARAHRGAGRRHLPRVVAPRARPPPPSAPTRPVRRSTVPSAASDPTPPTLDHPLRRLRPDPTDARPSPPPPPTRLDRCSTAPQGFFRLGR